MTIYDHTGQPIKVGRRSPNAPRVNNFSGWSGQTMFEGASRYPSGDITPSSWIDAARDTDKLLPEYDWKTLLNHGRFLLANVPILRGALLEQASYSFPLEPHYTGQDDDWGRLAKEWLYFWKMSADVRGQPYDCYTAARIRLLARKTDGDIARLLTFDEDTGYPRLQFIRAHRIGSRRKASDVGKDNTVKGGPYSGARICNGIILDRRGKMLAVRVLGDKESEDETIDAANVLLSFNPDYSDQSRGISELMAGITSFQDIKRLREYEMRAQQIQAREALVEQNEEGEAPPTHLEEDTDGEIVTGAGDVPFEVLEKGITRFYRSNTGSGLELVRPDRPGEGCQEFENRIVRGAFYGIEWDPDFALSLKEPGGAWARTILQKVNRAICNNQRIEARAELAEDTYALAIACYKLKILPKPKDGDLTSWDYSGPARLTADSGNDQAAKREAYKLGLLTLRQLSAEDGCWWEETRRQKELELRDLLVRATAVQKDFPELTLKECVELLEQRSPNPANLVQQEPGGAGEKVGK